MRDIFSKEIIKRAFESIANEMFWVTVRTSKSPIIYEVYDFSNGISKKNGDTVANSLTVPLWAGIHKFMSKSMITDVIKSGEEINEGDIIVSNDPYTTGTHLNDVGLALPIFHDNEIIAIATAKGHINDVGGMNPGSWGPGSTEIFQEGLYIPPVKYYIDGKRNNDVIKIILGNSRIPEDALGDLEALAASLRLAEIRMKNLIEKYNVNLVKESMNDLIEDGGKIALESLKELPKGEFYAEDFLDETDTNSMPMRINAKINITNKEIVVDFTGNPKSLPTPINTTGPATIASVNVVYLAIINPQIPFNQGLLKPLRIINPEGSIFNAQRPRPVCCYWETMTYASDLMWKALAEQIPERMSAGHFLSVCAEIIAGTDPRNGEYFVHVEPNPGGWGGSINKDGESALVCLADGETYTNPVEILERKFPVLVERHMLNIEEGTGHGMHRGGFGFIKEYKILTDDAVFTTSINRSRVPPWGVDKGQPGTVNSMSIIRDGETIMKAGKILDFKLKKDDIVSIKTGGGGGWGDPIKRKPEEVLQDVKDKLITIKQAQEVYKVIINEENIELEKNATDKEREIPKYEQKKIEIIAKGLGLDTEGKSEETIKEDIKRNLE